MWHLRTRISSGITFLYDLVLGISAGVPPGRHLVPFGRPFGAQNVPFGAFVGILLHSSGYEFALSWFHVRFW